MAQTSKNDLQYTLRLQQKIQKLFQNYIKPETVLPVFHSHNNQLLVPTDMELIKATTNQRGDRAGAEVLLDRLRLYDDWFPCLLKVLRDRKVKLPHVAQLMEQEQVELNRQIKSEEENSKTKIHVLEMELKDKDNQLAALKKQVESLDTEMKQRETCIDEQKIELVELNRQIKSEEENTKTKIHVLEMELKDKEVLTNQLENSEEELTAEIRRLENDVDRKELQLTGLKKDLVEREADVRRLTAEQAELTQERDQRVAENQEVQLQLDKKTEENSDLKANIDKLKKFSAINLLLVGKTGTGKSATGNSILRRKHFESSANIFRQTRDVSLAVSEYKDCVIRVVGDVGTIHNTLYDDAISGYKFVVGTAEQAMGMCPAGYDAILYVVRFGDRFTKEDRDSVVSSKRILGDFIKDHTILVMTRGDLFHIDNDTTFEEWCAEQTSFFGDLIRECNNRILLFDNITRDENKKEAQLKKLIDMVNNLRSQYGRYTKAHFDGAKGHRESFMEKECKKRCQQN